MLFWFGGVLLLFSGFWFGWVFCGCCVFGLVGFLLLFDMHGLVWVLLLLLSDIFSLGEVLLFGVLCLGGGVLVF